MALADYDTAAEKIAALKAAMIDPALIQMATSDFTTTENIYGISNGADMDGIITSLYYDNNLSIPSRIPSGIALTDITTHIFLYIKDSDIVYGNPIDTYQDRLVKIIESDIKAEDSNVSINAGTYGSMIKSLSYACIIYINSKHSGIYARASSPLQIVVPSGNNFKSDGSKGFQYIDLPADW